MAGPGVDIERIAAEEIAADEARSAGWVAPKAVAPPPVRVPWWRSLVGLGVVGLGLVVVIIVAIAVLGGGQPPIAEVTPSPTPTASPTEAATPSPEPPETPTPTPEGVSHAFTPDATGDAVTDSGAPAPDDAVVDITDVQTTQHADGSMDVQVDHAAPFPADADPGVSRAEQVVVGMSVPAEAGLGFVLAQQQPRFQTLAVFFWQLHDGELTMGELDVRTGQPISSTVVIEHVAELGRFIFRIPADRLPEGTNAFAIISFHRPTPADERRRDIAGPYSLEF